MMDWTQVLAIVGSNLVIIGGMLGTTIAMWFHLDKKIESNRKDTNDILKSIQNEMREFNQEMKDFHGRMCKIEEGRKGK